MTDHKSPIVNAFSFISVEAGNKKFMKLQFDPTIVASILISCEGFIFPLIPTTDFTKSSYIGKPVDDLFEVDVPFGSEIRIVTNDGIRLIIECSDGGIKESKY